MEPGLDLTSGSDVLRVGALGLEHPITAFERSLGMPDPLSVEEIRQFAELQERLVDHVRRVFPDPRAPRSVVVVPSLSISPDLLAKVDGVEYYEERLLFTLMLLRLPNTRLTMVTSQPIAPSIIDYYLHLLPGVPVNHAKARLTLLSCFDATPRPLTLKILERPRLIRRIRAAIGNPDDAHLTVFNATALERTLAVRLGVPLYACDPDACRAGTKSGGREVFREAGVPHPPGYENLTGAGDMIAALAELKRAHPRLRRAAVKLNEGVSGEGNAVFDYPGNMKADADLDRHLAERVPQELQFEARGEHWEHFTGEMARMGGVVEAWIDGTDKRSPSMQGRIDPLGRTGVVSTHDQVLGGPAGQVFLGCTFPAHGDYRLDIQTAGSRVGEVLQRQGVIGRFGVDFVSIPTPHGWRHYALEINVRKGGTTHPFLMLQFLTDGNYDSATGLYHAPSGSKLAYYASDNVVNPLYRGFTPADLIDIAVDHGLHFHSSTQEGVVFHLIGALSQYGKLGVLCISKNPSSAYALYEETVAVLDNEAKAQEDARRTCRVFLA